MTEEEIVVLLEARDETADLRRGEEGQRCTHGEGIGDLGAGASQPCPDDLLTL